MGLTSFPNPGGWPPSARLYTIAYSIEKMPKKYA
jgi:hypothetical protein